MPHQFLIYGLIDPRNGELRYVGKTVSGIGARLRGHLCTARKGSTCHVYYWLRQLLANGLKPEIEVLEKHDSHSTLYEAERWNIAYWRSIGANLTNHNDGGPGQWGFKHSDETKRKLSLANIGKVSPNKGKLATKETRTKLSISLSRYMAHSDSRIKASRANGGRAIIDQNGVIYASKNLAERILGIAHQNITKVLQGKIRHAGGYTFKYMEEPCPSLA